MIIPVYNIMLCRAHLGSEPAVVKVQGIDCMNDDPSAVKVLFAKLHLTDSSNRYSYVYDTYVYLNRSCQFLLY